MNFFSRAFGSKQESQKRWIDKAKSEKVTVNIAPGSETHLQMKMIQLTEEEIQIAKSIQSLIRTNVDAIVSSFYQSVLEVELLKQIIQRHSTIDKLKVTLQNHVIEMFNGRIDKEFLQRRIRVAERHVHIGLAPKWYMGAFQNLQNTLVDIVHQNITDSEEMIRITKVVTKILNFEQQLVLEAYEKENMRQQEMQYEKVKEELKSKVLSLSEELAALTEQTSASVEQLVANSNEVNHQFRQSALKSKDSQELAYKGQDRLNYLEKRIEEIFTSTQQMEETVIKLNESSNQIRHVIGLVQDIAEQTNLLALNSAIEAARAGEHGRGFSVVAGEVRKLSEQTKHSIKQITELIAQSSKFSEEVVESIKEVQTLVETGQVESKATKEAFDQIVKSMGSSIADIQNVEEQIGQLVFVIEEIGSATIKVSSSAEALNHAARHV
ncbi:protoglobin domain-containing protein [Brevibacillus sp. SYSU BS000544]|uniref:protoglobin domain-containing protein n=1 Tax=Brevibacillus sp. SYSU BS000544 TaxID=3416443 RepID=UPI003CE47298